MLEMMKPGKQCGLRPGVAQLIDVNLNRLTEGLKVIEDIIRFRLENRLLLRQIRSIRTNLGLKIAPLRRAVIESRRSGKDAGRADRFDRLRRQSLEDVLMANFKRAQESARVLEELFRVEGARGRRVPVNFKQLRFRLYSLEKRTVRQLRGKGLDLEG
jgi:thiamine-phosphate pyrophosphorylase